jgi:hypothetical protein
MQTTPPTTIGELSATGTGECRDKDGNLLDNLGFVVQRQEKDED